MRYSGSFVNCMKEFNIFGFYLLLFIWRDFVTIKLLKAYMRKTELDSYKKNCYCSICMRCGNVYSSRTICFYLNINSCLITCVRGVWFRRNFFLFLKSMASSHKDGCHRITGWRGARVRHVCGFWPPISGQLHAGRLHIGHQRNVRTASGLWLAGHGQPAADGCQQCWSLPPL